MSSLSEKKPPALEKFFTVLRFSVPQIFIFVLLLLSIEPVSLFGINDVKPPFLLLPIFYWSVFRPNVFPAPLAFGYGILIDVFTGSLLGFHAFIFILLQVFIKAQRRILMGQSFLTLWAGFLAIAIIDQLVKLVLSLLIKDMSSYPLDFFISGLSIVLLYPIFSLIFILMHRLISHVPAHKKGL